MKNNYYVYEIREKLTDKVVYVGETNQPHIRWFNHCKSHNKRHGFNLEIHYMNLLDEYIFNNREDAIKYQLDLQNHYGFENEKNKRRSKAIKDQNKKLICPHCNYKGKGTIMYRWHFDKCKSI